MEHTDMEEDGRMSGPPDERLSEMDQEDLMGVSGRDSPLKPTGGMEVGEDILAKLRQQVSAASLFGGHPNHHHTNHLLSSRDANNGTPTPGSPNTYPPHTPTHIHNNNNNITNNGHNNIYDRLHTLLQAKMKREDEGGDADEDARELALRAEALQRQRDSLLSSPHSLMSAMRGAPHPLLPPTPHLPFLPSSVGLPPSSQMPPTPGSAGSRDSSSGNGNRTPSHTPEPSQSQQPWSFEEQFKQVRGEDYGLPDTADSPRVREPAKHSSFEDDKRKLYELSTDSKRKDFLDELFAFMQKRGTPINRLPIMAKQVLDLYELYNLVVERGGLVDVINKKLWQEIIKGLKLPSSITSAAFTLRTQYMKYLYPFECEKKAFSNPAELQCAIDGNRREGRRSSYGTYGEMGGQPPLLPLQNLQNFQNFQGLQNPLSLVSRPQLNGNGTTHPLVSQDLLLRTGGSPPGSQEALLEATRLTMWKLYNQGLGGSLGASGAGAIPDDDGPRLPPPHLPMGSGGPPHPPQKEALNLDVKDDPISDPWMTFPRPRNKDNCDIRHSKNEEGGNQPPSAKRPHDEPHNQRLPTPNGGSTSLSVPGANIKITSRGDGRGQDQSLVVSMDINGILYQGVLFAQTPRSRFS